MSRAALDPLTAPSCCGRLRRRLVSVSAAAPQARRLPRCPRPRPCQRCQPLLPVHWHTRTRTRWDARSRLVRKRSLTTTWASLTTSRVAWTAGSRLQRREHSAAHLPVRQRQGRTRRTRAAVRKTLRVNGKVARRRMTDPCGLSTRQSRSNRQVGVAVAAAAAAAAAVPGQVAVAVQVSRPPTPLLSLQAGARLVRLPLLEVPQLACFQQLFHRLHKCGRLGGVAGPPNGDRI